jgi:DNA-binding NarL/FixJ family response regulator
LPDRRRVLVVEDESLVRTLLCSVLEAAGFETSSAASAAEAREMAEGFDPDAALIDINLGAGVNGIQLGHALHRLMPRVALVFLSKYYDTTVASGSPDALPPGAAFLSKNYLVDTEGLIDCIDRTLRRGSTPRRDDPTVGRTIAALSQVQLQTLRLTALGLTNAAIATRRGVSERAVERRLQEVYEVLGIQGSGLVNQRVEAVKRYVDEAGMPTDDLATRRRG